MNRDTVSNHSFFVALYANSIAQLIGWKGDYGRLLLMALTHDLDETVTGDIVSPVKHAIVDVMQANAYIDAAMKKRMPFLWAQMMHRPHDHEVYQIVTAADRLDAWLFLLVEKRMGNIHVGQRCQDVQDRFVDAWYKLPAERDMLLALMTSAVIPAIDEHLKMGSNGI